MKNEFIDAVKTAKSIHEGDYSSLNGKSFLIRDKIKNNEGQGKHVNRSKPKYTLNQLGSRIDQIGDALFEFIKTTNENFKQVNSRIDGIDARLDYIVKANNLKDSK